MPETRVRLSTEKGDIVLRFFPDKAPNHVANFQDLVKRGFYDGKVFHRTIKNFMIQGGCSRGDGTGSHPDNKRLKAEFNDTQHRPGILSAARSSDPDSAGAQFFICQGKPAPHLDRQYTAFGEVVEGQDVVDAIASAPTRGDKPLQPVKIRTATIEQA